MANPFDLQNEQLSRTDPIAPVRALLAQVESLNNEVVALREEIERLKGLEADRYFRPRLEASIVFLKHPNHFIYERMVLTLRELFGLEISEGGIAAIIARAGKLASDCAAEIRQAVTSSPIIQSDETSARVKGQNHWHLLALTIKKSNCKALDAFNRNPNYSG